MTIQPLGPKGGTFDPPTIQKYETPMADAIGQMLNQINSDEYTTYYTPMTYVENGKIKSMPCKITYYFNTIYKNNTFDKDIFTDYNDCQQYCIEKDLKNEK